MMWGRTSCMLQNIKTPSTTKDRATRQPKKNHRPSPPPDPSQIHWKIDSSSSPLLYPSYDDEWSGTGLVVVVVVRRRWHVSMMAAGRWQTGGLTWHFGNRHGLGSVGGGVLLDFSSSVGLFCLGGKRKRNLTCTTCIPFLSWLLLHPLRFVSSLTFSCLSMDSLAGGWGRLERRRKTPATIYISFLCNNFQP